jgi:hypothetical protein
MATSAMTSQQVALEKAEAMLRRAERSIGRQQAPAKANIAQLKDPGR